MQIERLKTNMTKNEQSFPSLFWFWILGFKSSNIWKLLQMLQLFFITFTLFFLTFYLFIYLFGGGDNNLLG